MPHTFGIPRRKRLGVRQLAAAFKHQFIAMKAHNQGASKLAHSKGFAFGKNYAALGETLALPAAGLFRVPPGAKHYWRDAESF